MYPKSFVCFDLETVPHPGLPDDCRPKFREEDVALGNLKDPFKIQDKLDQARAKFEMSVDKQMSVDPNLCMVCCAVVATFANGKLDGAMGLSTKSAGEEHGVIAAVWSSIRDAHQAGVPIVGFNSASFDLPVLIRRAMMLDVGVAPGMIQNLLRRQEMNHHHYDLMNLLGTRSPFSGKIEAKGLNSYLRLFGLGLKTTGMDGSLVYPMWKEGRHEEILEYCRMDVLQTAELFKRTAPWLVAPKEIESAKKAERPKSIRAAA